MSADVCCQTCRSSRAGGGRAGAPAPTQADPCVHQRPYLARARPRARGAGRLSSAAHQALPNPPRRPLRRLSSARRAARARLRPPRQAPAARHALEQSSPAERRSALQRCRAGARSAAPQHRDLERPCPSAPSAQGVVPGRRPCGAGAPPPASPGAAHLRPAPARRADSGSPAPQSGAAGVPVAPGQTNGAPAKARTTRICRGAHPGERRLEFVRACCVDVGLGVGLCVGRLCARREPGCSAQRAPHYVQRQSHARAAGLKGAAARRVTTAGRPSPSDVEAAQWRACLAGRGDDDNRAGQRHRGRDRGAHRISRSLTRRTCAPSGSRHLTPTVVPG